MSRIIVDPAKGPKEVLLRAGYTVHVQWKLGGHSLPRITVEPARRMNMDASDNAVILLQFHKNEPQIPHIFDQANRSQILLV